MAKKKSWCKGQTKETNIILARASIKQSKSHMGKKNPMYGKPAWNKGKKWSEEIKEKIRDARKGIKPSKKSIQKMLETKRERGYFKRDSERLKKNPLMHNPEIVKKQSETMKKKFINGELKIWNTKLNKKNNKNIEKQSRKLKEYYKNNPISIDTKNKISKALKGRNWEEIYGKEKSNKLRKKYSRLMKELKKEGKIILPVKDTSIEVKIQNYLKQLGYEFFTHQYMKEIKHGYQCDILIPTLNLVIECDGDYWHKYPIGNDIDHIRTKELLKKGFKVLRLWEREIKIMGLEEFKIKIQKIGEKDID